MLDTCINCVSIRFMDILSRLDLMRLDVANRGSLKSFKTICENVVTTPEGVKALIGFLSSKLDTIRSTPTSDDLNKYIAVMYSALAPKVTTDDDIIIVSIMIQPFDDIFVFSSQ